MRLTALLLTALIFAAACERKSSETTAPAPAIDIAEAPVSDELPGLPAAATGIAFWDHPTLSFNSTMIVATSNGVLAYSMEDGNEVSRIDGFNADGVATGYLGFGTTAIGFIAFLDADENAFRFYGVDNNSRAFLPLDPGPAIRGEVRGYCLGRAADAPAPSLYVVQRGKIQVFNLAAAAGGVAVESEAVIETRDDLSSCTVGLDGALLTATDEGAIYRVAGADAFATPFARAPGNNSGELAVVAAASEDDPTIVTAHILFASLADGAVYLFDADGGAIAGAAKISATDSLPGVDHGEVFNATGGNLGGLYRNGVVAFGVADGADGPVIRIAPVSSLKNATGLPVGEPVTPRGEAPAQDDDFLSIPTNFESE